jgi:hypothetical protein
MTTERKNEIATAVQKQMEQKKLSQSSAASMIGMSDATLHNMLNNKWENISEKMWQRALQWVGLGSTRWFEKPLITYDLNNIFSTCTDAQENARMLAVTAPTDFGKTTALKAFAGRTENCFYSFATVTMGRKEFLNAIQKSMGIEVDGSIHNRLYAIIEKLRDASYPLLIIDDCGKLQDSCLRLIQIIFDELEGHCGIILGGTSYFCNYVCKMAAKDKMGFQELKRRIGYWLPLRGMDMPFIRQAAKKFGITDEGAVAYIKDNCKGYGTLKELLVNYSILQARLEAEGNTEQGSQREKLEMIHTGISNELKRAA